MNLLRNVPTSRFADPAPLVISRFVVTDVILGEGTTGVVRLAKRIQDNAADTGDAASAATDPLESLFSPAQKDPMHGGAERESPGDDAMVFEPSPAPSSPVAGAADPEFAGKRERAGSLSSSGSSRGSRTPSPPGDTSSTGQAPARPIHRARPSVSPYSAVKVVRKDIGKCHAEALHEISILGQLQHRNIIRIGEVHEDLRNLYIFTEYLDERDIFRFMSEKRSGRPLPEQLAWKLFRQMCSALQYMHSQHICHSDFKLENCVISHTFDLRVIDFAYACKIPQGKLIRKFNGSPAYSAPEILFRRPHDETVDLWSLGVCLFFMLCGYFPFCDEQNTTLQELALNVRAGVLDFPFEDEVPGLQQSVPGAGLDQQPVCAPTEAARDMCTMLLSAKRRPSWNDITRHPFFRLYDSPHR